MLLARLTLMRDRFQQCDPDELLEALLQDDEFYDPDHLELVQVYSDQVNY